MDVEVPAHMHETAPRLGSGVLCALKVLASQLTKDPDMGDPSGLPGILTVMVDGGAFEDCPDLAVGYIREPERIEIRYVTPAPSTKPSADTQQPEEEQEQEELAIPSTNSVTEREIVDAWGRIARWLHDNAPASHAALRSGARQKAIDALEQNLDVPIPPRSARCGF